MDWKAIDKHILEKTEDAYIRINSLADEDDGAFGYFRELFNYFKHPENRKVYLNDFVNFYFSYLEEQIGESEKMLGHCQAVEKLWKRTYGTNIFLSLASWGGAFFADWVLAVPAILFTFWTNRSYDYLKDSRETRQHYSTLLNEARADKEAFDEIKPEALEKIVELVLEKNKENLMEWHDKAMELLKEE